jgi:histidine ammonia-lyase
LRIAQGDIQKDKLGEQILQTLADVREHSAFVSEDRALDNELRQLIDRIQSQAIALYS